MHLISLVESHRSPLAITIFGLFVAFTLGLSFWLGRKAKTAGGYFAAHGQVGWFVNGIAFAGDYLSAASFLGICGIIAFSGYDGFLYSIGFLGGWVVALFVIAEPIKKLGKYTFADALDSQFNSKGIRLVAAISTLVVSLFYLVPQMVGAGSLIVPLLGIAHYWGVLIVGGVVILIVTTAGMVSTTWVQFIKGSLLVIFCAVLVVAVLQRGIKVNAPPLQMSADGETIVLPSTTKSGFVSALPDGMTETGPLGPFDYVKTLSGSTLLTVKKPVANVSTTTATLTPASSLLVPGGYFKNIRSEKFIERLDFASLMVALFCGTASLPHILIRYYTVKDAAAARKSTVVGIIAIGFFYMLTLYIGLGAMVSGNMDPTDTNMAAPLLAKAFGDLPFALITGIAFTTVLGTVSGLIVAASGAVAHDIMETFMGHEMTDHGKVTAAKWAAVGTGVVAVILGILAKNFNVAFLVGWAFNVAASANLPAIVMLLFWKRITKEGMIASITVGLVSSVAWLLMTKEAFLYLYNVADSHGIVPFSQPGLFTIPLAFIVLIVVSLMTPKKETRAAFVAAR